MIALLVLFVIRRVFVLCEQVLMGLSLAGVGAGLILLGLYWRAKRRRLADLPVCFTHKQS